MTFLLLLSTICRQKKSKIDFSSLAEEIRFYPIFVEIVSYNLFSDNPTSSEAGADINGGRVVAQEFTQCNTGN